MTEQINNGAEQAAERGDRKTRRGYVVSDKMDKTVVVQLQDNVKHSLYGKVMRRSSKVKAHDEQNAAGVGDLDLPRLDGAAGVGRRHGEEVGCELAGQPPPEHRRDSGVVPGDGAQRVRGQGCCHELATAVGHERQATERRWNVLQTTPTE